MALIHCNFLSYVLGIQCSMEVILPQPYIGITDPIPPHPQKHPVLYLLHGLYDDHTAWQRYTSIERYANRYNLAIVMPAAGRAFYTDMVTGYRYGTFITEELPRIAATLFPLETNRKNSYLAGLSMGGYGAFKIGLTHPERYRMVGSLSGALDIVRFISSVTDPGWRAELGWIFGNLGQLPGSPHDLFHLADELMSTDKPKPDFYQWCGTEDFLYGDNIRFRDYARQIAMPLTYEEGPGIHDWRYWDQQIEHFLALLPLEKHAQSEMDFSMNPERIFQPDMPLHPHQESNLN